MKANDDDEPGTQCSKSYKPHYKLILLKLKYKKKTFSNSNWNWQIFSFCLICVQAKKEINFKEFFPPLQFYLIKGGKYCFFNIKFSSLKIKLKNKVINFFFQSEFNKTFRQSKSNNAIFKCLGMLCGEKKVIEILFFKKKIHFDIIWKWSTF